MKRSLFLLWLTLAAAARADTFDVVVYGGTPGGVAAGIAAARAGASAVIIEPTRRVGGLSTSGLCNDEVNHMHPWTVTGFAREFFERLGRQYGNPPLEKVWVPRKNHWEPLNTWESKVAKRVFEEMLAEAGVAVRYGVRVLEAVRQGPRITRIILDDGSEVAGRVFIDCSYEGDLMARAGVGFTFGREARTQYGESLAGIHIGDRRFKARTRDERGDLLPGISATIDQLEPGAGDRKVLNYNFRLTLTKDRTNQVPFPRPQSDDAGRYALLAKYLKEHPQTRFTDLVAIHPLPGGKWEANNHQGAIISLGHPGGQFDYPDSDYATRDRIYQDHVDYTQGLLWFLSNDPAVPAALRAELAEWGMAKDEYVENDNWPPALYVREARRMIGAVMMTQQNIQEDRRKPDSIGLGSHYIDGHEVQRVAVGDEEFTNEGRIWVEGNVFEVPYRAITPRVEECDNLLVPVAASFSHVAFCAYRVEPTWMMAGQAAGIAAHLAARQDVAVQNVPIEALQDRLAAAGQLFRLTRDEPLEADVLVYGATPAGITAALAAADDGSSVLLVESTGRIGGLLTAGLSHTDFHAFDGLTGTYLDFTQRVERHYAGTYGKDSPQVKDSFRGTFGEPSVNLKVLEAMLAERRGVIVERGARLVAVATADGGRRIVSARFARTDGTEFVAPAAMFVDGTYEGDLMAAAGVPWRVGREGKDEYGESRAPEKPDGQVQAYNFRFVMTREPGNRVTVQPPPDYDRAVFLDVLDVIKEGKLKSVFGYPSGCAFKAQVPPLPNGKYDINDVSGAAIRLSLPGVNTAWPDGDEQARSRVFAAHLRDQWGLLYFLQNDDAVPRALRDEAREWGWCKDEFADTNHLPPRLYVREARRMEGMEVFSERDSAAEPGDARAVLHRDAIAFGEYGNNCHGTGHEGPRFGGRHTGEFYAVTPPYQIPYGVIVPQVVENLLVPGAVSASHVGFCALRLEPIWASLGQASGHAAHLARVGKLPVQKVEVKRLQARLHRAGAGTMYFSDVLPGHVDFAAVQWWGTAGGFHGLLPAPPGGPRGKHIVGQYHESHPHHAAQLGQVLDAALAERWAALARELKLPAEKLPVADGTLTRGEWVRTAFSLER